MMFKIMYFLHFFNYRCINFKLLYIEINDYFNFYFREQLYIIRYFRPKTFTVLQILRNLT